MSGTDEFRVEIELGDSEHHLTLGDRLSALDLDDDARERLGSAVVVTRDGNHLFLYANSRESAAEAARVAALLLEADGLPATVATTRWHPTERAWKDADQPLPETPAEVEAEERAAAANEVPDGDPRPEAPSFVLLGSYKPRFLRDLGL